MSRPYAPADRPPGETERATPEQVETARAAISGMRTESVQQGWWKVYGVGGEPIGDLHRERARTGEPMLYNARTVQGRRVSVVLADREPVLAALLAAYRAAS